MEIGQTIAHYRILSPLGQGGMGVIYLAEDLRLGRRVALKFLPENLARDLAAFRRLQREARTACRLNHPNICTIYEVEEYEGQPVIVMELLEGQTLKERLREAPMSLVQVLEVGAQVADALDAAHSAGIIHRDIKPANIFLTQRGPVKVLDFGLAKLVSRLAAGAESSTTPEALEESLTAVGVIPGTTTYMSPEQVKGEELDFRTDLFSFGIVVYEMATGQHPFRKKNAVLSMEAILNFRPEPASKLNPQVSLEFDRVLGKLLEKERTQRYENTRLLCEGLTQLKHATAQSENPAGQRPVKTEYVAGHSEPKTKTRHSVTTFWKVFLAGSAVILAITAGITLYSRRATALRETDSIVLADFDNKTGDPVFDDTLKQALVVDLGQSPFLNIISDRQMAATLRLMGRSPDQPATGEVARELCQRVGSKAMLAGSISNLGNEYIIGLNAINCSTGDRLVAEQARASGKGEVLKSLDNSASAMRSKLGESLASVQKFATPIEEATTSSLEALKAYSLGRRAGFSKGDVAGIPYYQRALELDPNFALAYRALSVAYINLGQSTRAMEALKKAFELRERVSEHEKYSISTRYYSDVTGELDKANQVYELWSESYPRDFLPLLNLGDNYMRLGNWEKVLQESKASLRLEPNSGVTNSNLATALFALNRPEEAKTTVEQAIAHKMDFYDLRLDLYHAAFLNGDQERMRQQLDWATGRSGEEDWLLSAQSDTEAYFGRLAAARDFSRHAVDLAERADAKEIAALWRTNAALREAEMGNADLARQNVLSALALIEGRDVRSTAALAMARAGDPSHAHKIAESVSRDFPENTILQGYWLPSIQAAIAIHEQNPSKALQILQVATPYELAQSQPFRVGMLYPVYLRGQAYLLAHQGKEAAAEFQKIIDHRGIVLNFPLGALAHLGLGRAYALEGDAVQARNAYQDFLTLWKDADPEIPILQQAKGEYAKLK